MFLSIHGNLMLSDIVLAMVLDCRFGSRSGSEPNPGQIGFPGRHCTRTVYQGKVEWKSCHQSGLAGLSAGYQVGLSVDSYNGLAFAV